jgi:hypothetical protein
MDGKLNVHPDHTKSGMKILFKKWQKLPHIAEHRDIIKHKLTVEATSLEAALRAALRPSLGVHR